MTSPLRNEKLCIIEEASRRFYHDKTNANDDKPNGDGDADDQAQEPAEATADPTKAPAAPETGPHGVEEVTFMASVEP
jgi:hypothetical protein